MQNIRESDLKDIMFHTVALGKGINGFVYVSKRGFSHVFVSDSLSEECTASTLAHEVYHLKYDKISRGIGLDTQFNEPELEAKKFATTNTCKTKTFMCTIST